jgi:hypothetical protein
VRNNTLAWDLAFNGSTLHNEILELGTVGTFINNFRAFTEGRQIAAYWAPQDSQRRRRRGTRSSRRTPPNSSAINCRRSRRP